MLDGYFKPGKIDDELLKYAYNDQNGKESAYKPARSINVNITE